MKIYVPHHIHSSGSSNSRFRLSGSACRYIEPLWRPQRDRLGNLSLAVFKRSGPLVISAEPAQTLTNEENIVSLVFSRITFYRKLKRR